MPTSLPLLTPEAVACCASGADGALDDEAAQPLARLFRALADPTRVRLLSIIAAAEGQEACICDLTGPVGLAQPTVSHHMKQLVEAGLVTREQRGRWAYFGLVPGMADSLSSALDFLR